MPSPESGTFIAVAGASASGAKLETLPEALVEAGAIGVKPPDDVDPAGGVDPVGGVGPAVGAAVCGSVGTPEDNSTEPLTALPFTEFAGVKIAG